MAHEMFDYLATTFRDSTRIPLPTKKPVKASSGDVAEDELLSTKNLLEQNSSAFKAHASGDEMQDELRESCTRPNKLPVELPREERLEDELTEVRSNDEAEAAVGAAQQVPSRSIEVEDHEPEVPSESCMAQSELQEQPSSRAGRPLESEHPQVLNGTVKVPHEVEDVDRAVELASEAAGRASGVDTRDEMAHEDLPSKLCDGSTPKDMPGTQRLPLEGEQAVCTSSNVKDMSTAPVRCKDGPQEQARLVDISHGNHRCGTSMDMIANEADTPSTADNAETIPINLDEVSNESRGISDMVAAEGSLGAEATDIAVSIGVTTQTTNANQEGGDTKVYYQIPKPTNAGAASCVKTRPAGAYSQPKLGQPNEIRTWNTQEATNVLLEGEQNGCTSSDVENEQSGNNDEPRLTIHDPGGRLGHATFLLLTVLLDPADINSQQSEQATNSYVCPCIIPPPCDSMEAYLLLEVARSDRQISLKWKDLAYEIVHHNTITLQLNHIFLE
ncbi:hypothetical protein EDC04DRAFT_2979373 [Pisolithus marmoratus]|nr:hypothetical protein EDC04DRAFT_2979373 [Pisolithus marmoratus]